jgi:hypothetical protein
LGGVVPFPEEIHQEILRVAKEPLSITGDPRQGWMQRLQAALN